MWDSARAHPRLAPGQTVNKAVFYHWQLLESRGLQAEVHTPLGDRMIPKNCAVSLEDEVKESTCRFSTAIIFFLRIVLSEDGSLLHVFTTAFYNFSFCWFSPEKHTPLPPPTLLCPPKARSVGEADAGQRKCRC